MKKSFLLLLFYASCAHDRPWTVIEIRQKGDRCEYVLSRSNGFGPQIKSLVTKCDQYRLFQKVPDKSLFKELHQSSNQKP